MVKEVKQYVDLYPAGKIILQIKRTVTLLILLVLLSINTYAITGEHQGNISGPSPDISTLSIVWRSVLMAGRLLVEAKTGQCSYGIPKRPDPSGCLLGIDVLFPV